MIIARGGRTDRPDSSSRLGARFKVPRTDVVCAAQIVHHIRTKWKKKNETKRKRVVIIILARAVALAFIIQRTRFPGSHWRVRFAVHYFVSPLAPFHEHFYDFHNGDPIGSYGTYNYRAPSVCKSQEMSAHVWCVHSVVRRTRQCATAVGIFPYYRINEPYMSL